MQRTKTTGQPLNQIRTSNSKGTCQVVCMYLYTYTPVCTNICNDIIYLYIEIIKEKDYEFEVGGET